MAGARCGAVRDRRLALRRPGGRARLGRLGPPRGLRDRRRGGRGASGCSRPRSCARTSRSASSPTTPRPRRPPSTAPPRCGPRRRARCCCGSCCSALWSSLMLFLTRRRGRARSRPTRRPCCSASRVFFLLAAGVPREPVRPRVDRRWPRAPGLNPLLRHPSMMIHPPMLYSGYTLFAVPFAFAVGALITRRLDAEWIRLDAAVHARRLALPRHRHPARRALVVHRARLGRLLGLGPGGERVADAVADRHRVPALRDDPGEARDAEDLERLAGAGDGRARDPRHLPRALGDPQLDPRVRRLDARRAVPDPDRGADRGLGRARALARERPALRAPARLAALARGGLPAQQPRAGRRSAS